MSANTLSTYFPVHVVKYKMMRPKAEVLKKLSLAGLARLSRLRFVLASAGYRGLGVHDRPVYTAG